MASGSKGSRARRMDRAAVLSTYGRWVRRQPLAPRTKDAYRAQVQGFIQWLAGSEHGAAALSDDAVRDWAVRDYKRYVKRSRRWAPTSVNQALAAIDNFYRSLNMGRPNVKREQLAQVAPRALNENEQRAFLRAVERSPSARDRAIAQILFYAGLRLSELAGLDLDDVSVSARRGRVTVRSGKGDAYRQVPLNSECRKALQEWLRDRSRQVAPQRSSRSKAAGPQPLWLSRSGGRMTPRGIDFVIRGLAAEAGLELSAHVLRHTFVTRLMRSGSDVVLVAELAGHKRLDTTRRYSLPSQADRDAAVEAVVLDI